jgi:hypothetical protein
MNKEERRKMVREVWEKMKPWERFMTTALVLVGILMSLTGLAMMVRGCQAM